MRHHEIPEAVRGLMQSLGQGIGDKCPEGWGFALMLFEMNREDGIALYISSAERETVIPTIRKLADSMETQVKAEGN